MSKPEFVGVVERRPESPGILGIKLANGEFMQAKDAYRFTQDFGPLNGTNDIDVGKRIFLHREIMVYVMENQQQRDRRRAKGEPDMPVSDKDETTVRLTREQYALLTNETSVWDSPIGAEIRAIFRRPFVADPVTL